MISATVLGSVAVTAENTGLSSVPGNGDGDVLGGASVKAVIDLTDSRRSGTGRRRRNRGWRARPRRSRRCPGAAVGDDRTVASAAGGHGGETAEVSRATTDHVTEEPTTDAVSVPPRRYENCQRAVDHARSLVRGVEDFGNGTRTGGGDGGNTGLSSVPRIKNGDDDVLAVPSDGKASLILTR